MSCFSFYVHSIKNFTQQAFENILFNYLEFPSGFKMSTYRQLTPAGSEFPIEYPLYPVLLAEAGGGREDPSMATGYDSFTVLPDTFSGMTDVN
jgi:hypothetical protein